MTGGLLKAIATYHTSPRYPMIDDWIRLGHQRVPPRPMAVGLSTTKGYPETDDRRLFDHHRVPLDR